MKIPDLTRRALEVRTLFDVANRAAGRRVWTREEIAQGFVADVGDLTKLAMAKAGLRELAGVDDRLAHELADCLWSILVLADAYGVDLEKAFLATMNQLERDIQS